MESLDAFVVKMTALPACDLHYGTQENTEEGVARAALVYVPVMTLNKIIVSVGYVLSLQ